MTDFDIRTAGAELARRTRAAQGIGPAIEDPAAIAAIAAIAAAALQRPRKTEDPGPPRPGSSNLADRPSSKAAINAKRT